MNIACDSLALPGGLTAPVYRVNALVVGSGAAGLNCAEHLHDLGATPVAVVTARLGAGTSANSGSDKQTYYKIGVAGDAPDSPMDFARVLFQGGMMHGDIAYCEAVGSATEFFHLVKNGVPFPFNRYGAYCGYKTDHDPRQRATSCGPKTSMLMVEKSLAQVRRNGTAIFDRHEVIDLLFAGQGPARRVIGALALDFNRLDAPDRGLVVFAANAVVLATGGPGEMYKASVYPPGQMGSHGLALKAGCAAANLTESQFGLGSTKFRWNLSGTYQQVIPDYFSAGADGKNRRHFLPDYFDSTAQMATAIFLKGYQWPFNAACVGPGGSSLVDLAVHAEIEQGRRVFLDFTRNPTPGPGKEPFDLARLAPEAATYLQRSGASQPTPLERLRHMNPDAIAIYDEHCVDLREPLDAGVLSQHNNGGICADLWWETAVPRLFAIGELNGSHGIRPGGSALNAGQVGGLRAAQAIAARYSGASMAAPAFNALAAPQAQAALDAIKRIESAPDSAPLCRDVRHEIQERMTRAAAFIRTEQGVAQALSEARALQDRLNRHGIRLATLRELPRAIENQYLCLTHLAFLEAIHAYIQLGGGSRGSYMIADPKGAGAARSAKGELLRYRPENMDLRKQVLEVRLDPRGAFKTTLVPVRPLPQDDSWFETVWAEWKSGKVFEK